MSINHTELLGRFAQEPNDKLSVLHDAIAEGDKAICSGESEVFNSAEELDRFFNQF